MPKRSDSGPQEIELWLDESSEVSTLSLVNRDGKAALLNPGREEVTMFNGDGSAGSPFCIGESASIGYMSGHNIGIGCFESGTVLAPKQLPPGQLACLAADGKGSVYACIRAPKEDSPERIFKVVVAGSGAGKVPTHIASLRQHARAACMAFHPPSNSLIIGTDNHGLFSVGVSGSKAQAVQLELEEVSDGDDLESTGGGDDSDNEGAWGDDGGFSDDDDGSDGGVEPEWPGIRISGVAVDTHGCLIVADAYERGRGWGPVGSRALIGRVSRFQLAGAQAGACVLRGRETLLKGMGSVLQHLHVLACGFLAALAFDKLQQFKPEGVAPWFWRLPPPPRDAEGAGTSAAAGAKRAGGGHVADGHARKLAGMFLGGGSAADVVELHVGKTAGGPAMTFSIHRAVLTGGCSWLASGLAKSTGALKATSEQQKALDGMLPQVFAVVLAYVYSGGVDFEGVAADHPAAALATASAAAGGKAAGGSKAAAGKGGAGKKGGKGGAGVGASNSGDGAVVAAGSSGALELAKAVAVAAERLQLPGLREAAEAYLTSQVSPDTLGPLLTWATAAPGQQLGGGLQELVSRLKAWAVEHEGDMSEAQLQALPAALVKELYVGSVKRRRTGK
ncbi:hypothetical protein CHLRE_12g520900v5 [Chlamydomonas reinhardtii]|uniref:BTB domain-containing protein n=1 Tax=Chlamydomonas reinhardtii TaxID=3055 RepID=A0A2K3D451_CHLRE|nr:uncharacterized protein CHLRE_12g520900v5 [Chlamydomonas reinhardtii]PNW75291.1 hypothetical protein CHLRE_12g520900v5 [Chlamydomonas reinhardtii]